MIKIDTKFKIGDIVRPKIKRIEFIKMPCPFCKGKGHIEYNKTKLQCEACIDGIYHMKYQQLEWGPKRTVIGATIINNILTQNKDVKKICVNSILADCNSLGVFNEDDLEFADKVREGELCES